MFVDLNVIWPSLGVKDMTIVNTVKMLEKLGYAAVALNYQYDGKLQNIIKNPIPATLYPGQKIKIYSRITITIESTPQNKVLHNATKEFDILALRPVGERLLQQTASDLEFDILSFDFSQRLPFYLKHTIMGLAVSRGIGIEISYASGLREASSRRNLVTNASSLVRATRGRGILISSETRSPLECRAGFDVINLATFWDMKQDQARHAIGGFCRSVILHAETRRDTYRSAVKLVDEGDATSNKRLKTAA
ncbi:RNase P and RNase MRP subunit p30 [Schizosaccharomyces cryophilus OY26]|uniref:RNase P and RNase MRP subunit p30 n=1 Tax=Schizosaccharomyces cryophilus (strain OY26 / ATCC MYA-4695 / CBS 11777 / NBRC 106824 / NRRL Y48691) TaxID=653667 RepID=S9VXL7_SCHCR|nr:RNase P and RNase MRP subunit p30 [Schizosaccharomyces cryophilus OY26]EPY50949.1 RNase P and RNase MRP subunit p30 [Schizosaccharomyces cryophilus OY26]